MKKSIIDEIREYIKCPQFDGGEDYGEWGALRFSQRLKIKQLCDYAKALENIVENNIGWLSADDVILNKKD